MNIKNKKEWIDRPVKTVTFSEPDKKEGEKASGNEQSIEQQESGSK